MPSQDPTTPNPKSDKETEPAAPSTSPEPMSTPGAPEIPPAEPDQTESAPAHQNPTAPQPAQAADKKTEDPGHAMSIVSIVLPFLGLSLIGLILSIVAHSKSKKAGFKNTLAIIGIILNAIFLVLGTIWLIIVIFVASSGLTNATNDTEAMKDINNQYAQLESFYFTNKYYPASLSEVASINQDMLSAPEGYKYVYTPSPDDCTRCSDYSLETQLSDGTSYTKKAIKE